MIKTHEENAIIRDLKIKLAQAEFEASRVKVEYTLLARAHSLLLGAQEQVIAPDLLKILTLLCHPDKHNNSPAAEKATKYLLKQRKK